MKKLPKNTLAIVLRTIAAVASNPKRAAIIVAAVLAAFAAHQLGLIDEIKTDDIPIGPEPIPEPAGVAGGEAMGRPLEIE